MQWDFGCKLSSSSADHGYKITPTSDHNIHNSNCSNHNININQQNNCNDDNNTDKCCPDCPIEPSANYCKIIFKITIVFLSFAGFLYQATDICTHYFSYRTVVYTNTEQESTIDLPSLTFCLPTYFSKQTLDTLYGTHIRRSMDEALQFNRSLLPSIEPLIYDSFHRQAFKDLNTEKILDNSLNSYNTIECRLYYPPLKWLNLTHHKLYEIIQYGIPCEEVSEIIESINANGKCFTFFSQLMSSDSDSFKISVNRGYRFHSGRFMKLQIQFNRDEYSAISDGQQRECIQVHPPFKIPSEACLHSINPGMSYDLVITKTKAILQPPPYQTDCYSYHITRESDSMSRSDCIDKCMLSVYESKCKCLPIHITIWRNNANLNLSICNYDDFDSISECLEQELSNNCYDRCKPDCIDRHYHIEVESRTYPSDEQIRRAIGSDRDRLLSLRNSAATINIWSNYLSDVTYVHTPAMSLIQLVCYLGGLAGLWLGVSVMTVSGWLAQLYPFLQKWKGQQQHLFLHCKRHLPLGGSKKISPDDLLLNPELNKNDMFLHRPSVCSLSQFNPRF